MDQIIERIAGKKLPPDSKFVHEWASWYAGDVFEFHNYRVYNGTDYINMRRKTLAMAKQVCESWANLLMNERCDIVLPKEPKKIIDQVFNQNNFWLKANEGIERSFALGLGAFVVNVVNLEQGERSGIIRVTDKSKVTIDFVNRYKIRPITVENKQITECAFVTENSDSTNIVVHMIGKNGNYVIHNVKVQDNKIIDEYTFDTQSDIPFFQIIRPNVSSNVLVSGYDAEIGISIFANSIDTLKAIDNKYDAFDQEYVLGRKRIFVKSDLFNMRPKEAGGTTRVPVFDPYNTLFQILPDNIQDGKPMIEDKSGDLRAEAYITGLNTELNILSMKCGLGETYYKMNGSGVATATQVITENSTLFRSLKKHEILLENALFYLTKSVIYALSKFTKTPIGEVKDDEIKIVFDDSIIEDKGAEMERDKADVAAGLMSKLEYRMKWYGEDEKTALENIRKYMIHDEIAKYMSAVVQGVMTPDEFVRRVYGTTEGYEDEVAYIYEQLSQGDMPDMSVLYAGDEGGINEDNTNEDDDESQED